MPLHKNTDTDEVRDLPAELIAGWAEAGNPKAVKWEPYRPSEPEPYVAPVPFEVGPYQIRAALILSGIAADEAALDAMINEAVDATIPDATQAALAKLAWRRASAFKRNSPFIAAAQAALQLKNEQVNDLFRLANTL